MSHNATGGNRYTTGEVPRNIVVGDRQFNPAALSKRTLALFAAAYLVEALESRVLLSGAAPSGYSVAQMRGAYGLGQYNASNIVFNGAQGDGTGQTIAITVAYNDPTISTDLVEFDASEGLPAPPSFKVLNQSGVTSPLPINSPQGSNWAASAATEVEWAHAMAPGANIILFEATNSSGLFQCAATAAAYSGVSVVSSYGNFGSEFSSESSYDGSYFARRRGIPA